MRLLSVCVLFPPIEYTESCSGSQLVYFQVILYLQDLFVSLVESRVPLLQDLLCSTTSALYGVSPEYPEHSMRSLHSFWLELKCLSTLLTFSICLAGSFPLVFSLVIVPFSRLTEYPLHTQQLSFQPDSGDPWADFWSSFSSQLLPLQFSVPHNPEISGFPKSTFSLLSVLGTTCSAWIYTNLCRVQ